MHVLIEKFGILVVFYPLMAFFVIMERYFLLFFKPISPSFNLCTHEMSSTFLEDRRSSSLVRRDQMHAPTAGLRMVCRHGIL